MKLAKETTSPKLPRDRWYDDACGTALALEFVGERWSLLVMRELMLGPRRFSELKADLTGISANVLSQRLAGLERSGIVRRRKLPPPASVQVYELTDWGLEAEPIFQAMGRWAVRSPLHDPMRPPRSAPLRHQQQARRPIGHDEHTTREPRLSCQRAAAQWRRYYHFMVGCVGLVPFGSHTVSDSASSARTPAIR